MCHTKKEKKRMDRTSNVLKKKLLSISNTVYFTIIIIATLCIALLLSLMLNSIKTNKSMNSESGVATFDYYKITRHVVDNSVIDVRIYLENGDVLLIDSEDYSTKLEIALIDLEKGEELHFILNTENGNVLKLTSDTLIYEKGRSPIPISVCVILLILSISFVTVSIVALVLQNTERKRNDFINRKAAEFSKYSYKITTISEKSCWIILACNEVDLTEDGADAFANLLKRIAVKLNKGYWENAFSEVGKQRYQIKNDPFSLTYQYDTLFGIVIEYKKETSLNILMKFLLDIAQIQYNIK